jgi:hypothetical protein
MATFRDELIRAVFEARRDVKWWEGVEPQLRDNGFDADSINICREAWNEKMEKDNWGRWQTEATRFSNAVLEEMRTNYFDRLDVVVFRVMRDKAASDREKFQQVLRGTPEREETPQKRSRDQGRGM